MFAFQDMLSYEPVFIYMDSSVRVTSANVSDIFNQVLLNKGVVIFGFGGHTNARVTWPPMYTYLPTNISRQSTVKSSESTMVYMNTHENYENFMRWHILCSLVKECIAPSDQIFCNFTAMPAPHHVCHRYDMSALNLLLSNYHNFNWSAYYHSSRTQFRVMRTDNKLSEEDKIRFNDLVIKRNSNSSSSYGIP